MFGRKKYDKIDYMCAVMDYIREDIQYIYKEMRDCKNATRRIEENLRNREIREKRKPKSAQIDIIAPTASRAPKGKKKKLNFMPKTNTEGLALNAKAQEKNYPIEYEFKKKTDMTLADFAKKLKIPESTLRSRLSTIKKNGGKWVENDNFVYYIRKNKTNYLVKVLTKAAQEQVIRDLRNRPQRKYKSRGA